MTGGRPSLICSWLIQMLQWNPDNRPTTKQLSDNFAMAERELTSKVSSTIYIFNPQKTKNNERKSNKQEPCNCIDNTCPRPVLPLLPIAGPEETSIQRIYC